MAISYYKGPDTYIIYGAETIYGDGGTPTGTNRIGKVQSVNVSMTNNNQRYQGMGNGRNANGAVLGIFDITATADIQVDEDALKFMQYFVGEVQGAGTVASPYELVELDNYGQTAATHIQSLGMQIGSEGDANDNTWDLKGVQGNTLTLNMNQGEIMTATYDFIVQTMESGTTLTAYTPDITKPFTFQSGAVTINSEAFDCMSFSMTLTNTAQIHRNLGSRLIVQPVTGVRRYDFTLTFKFKFDSTAATLSGTELLAYFFGAATAPLDGAAATAYDMNVSVNEGAVADDRVIDIDLNNCYFESWSQPMPLEGGVFEVTVNGFGLNGEADGADLVPIRWYTIV